MWTNFAGALRALYVNHGYLGAPDRKKQIQDAKDMYQIVARNAERAGSEPPPYKFLELIGKGAFGRVYKW